jgi:murein DD-endopeptidase MepM/ murein hydrolase activator NlpD
MARAAAIALLAVWHWPVHGPVVRPFAAPAQRYAAGAHRGIDIAATRGTAVRAACDGRVTFAGRVPGSGRVVSQRCGALVATYTHLGAIGVRRGERLHPGERLGAASRFVHLGARRGDTYVDPLTLLAEDTAPVAPPPAPVAPRRPGARPPPPPPPLTPAHRPVPSIAWLGAALLAVAVPGVTVGRALRRRRRARRHAVAQ